MTMPIEPCATLQFIRDERIKAVIKGEHGEVMRRNREETEHLEKCLTCAASIIPLYQQLWSNAKIGVDIHVSTE
jgi:hypothetical protein